MRISPCLLHLASDLSGTNTFSFRALILLALCSHVSSSEILSMAFSQDRASMRLAMATVTAYGSWVLLTLHDITRRPCCTTVRAMRDSEKRLLLNVWNPGVILKSEACFFPFSLALHVSCRGGCLMLCFHFEMYFTSRWKLTSRCFLLRDVPPTPPLFKMYSYHFLRALSLYSISRCVSPPDGTFTFPLF